MTPIQREAIYRDYHGEGWRFSSTLDSSFCVNALEEAIDKYGCPDIFIIDQGSQFTAEAFTVYRHPSFEGHIDQYGR